MSMKSLPQKPNIQLGKSLLTCATVPHPRCCSKINLIFESLTLQSHYFLFLSDREEVIERHNLDHHSTGFVRWIDNNYGTTAPNDENSTQQPTGTNLEVGKNSKGQSTTTILKPFRAVLNTVSSPLSSRRKQSMKDNNSASCNNNDDDDGSTQSAGIRWAFVPNQGVELDAVADVSTLTNTYTLT